MSEASLNSILDKYGLKTQLFHLPEQLICQTTIDNPELTKLIDELSALMRGQARSDVIIVRRSR